MRISDWSSDVCSSDLADDEVGAHAHVACSSVGIVGGERRRRCPRRTPQFVQRQVRNGATGTGLAIEDHLVGLAQYALHGLQVHAPPCDVGILAVGLRSEEHTSELQSLMRNSYAV